MKAEHQTSDPDEQEPSVEIERIESPGATFDAVVRLHGGHDVATSRYLRDALKEVDGNVLLDLSSCQFIDSSVIFVIYNDSNVRARQGQRLELVVPPSNRTVSRTLEIAGAKQVLGVLDSLPNAS
jgi:anti-anti-sigma factor